MNRISFRNIFQTLTGGWKKHRAQAHLMDGIYYSDKSMVRMAIDRGADVNQLELRYIPSMGHRKLMTCPLAVAQLSQFHGYDAIEVFELLVAAGADIDGPASEQIYVTPLMITAISTGPWFGKLMRMGADPFANRGNIDFGKLHVQLLVCAAITDEDPVYWLRKMIELGVYPRATTPSGQSVIELTAVTLLRRRPDVLRELMLLGADPNVTIEKEDLMRRYQDIRLDAEREIGAAANARLASDLVTTKSNKVRL